MHNFKYTANAKYKPPFELTKEQKKHYYNLLNKPKNDFSSMVAFGSIIGIITLILIEILKI